MSSAPTHPKAPTTPQAVRLITRSEVLAILRISNSTLWRGIELRYYPAPVQIGLRAKRWNLADVLAVAERGIR